MTPSGPDARPRDDESRHTEFAIYDSLSGVMDIPPNLQVRAAELKDGERFVRVASEQGAPCFELSLRNADMAWESFPDSPRCPGSWSFGEAALPAGHAQEFRTLFDEAFAAEPAESSRGQELTLLWRKGPDVRCRRYPLVSPERPTAAQHRLVSQCSNQVVTWARAATLEQSYVCFATEALGVQWAGPDSVMLLRRSGAQTETVRCRFADLGAQEGAIRVLARKGRLAKVHTSAQSLVPTPVPTEGPAFLVAVRRYDETWTIQSATSDSSFEELFAALAKPDASSETTSPNASRKTPAGLPDTERAELEKRLGGHYALDGSFASLWALEEILIPIRRAPLLGKHLDWMAVYLADLFERAFLEMGMKLERESPSRIAVRTPIRYCFDTRSDVAKLIRPPKTLPTFYGIRWAGSTGLGSSMVPWYGLSTVFQNNAWAETDHDMIGRQRDRMDRAVPWLSKEYARVLDLTEAHRELAEKVARWMVWPPLGYAQNEYGAHNLPKLQQVVADADAGDARALLDAFVAGQDRACQLLAAATAIHFAIPPDTRHEARVYRDASKFFRVEVPPFIEKSIEAHTVKLETPNPDADHPEYAAVYAAKPALGVEIADRVLAKEPTLPVFHCSRGRHLEALKRKDEALAAYHEAIRLKPDYVQARINRGGMYGMSADFARADADFFAAREVRPDDPDLRGNLILNHYFAKSKAQDEAGAQASPKRSAASPSAAQPTDRQEAAGKALRALLRRYSAKQATQNEVMRALMSYEHFLAPSTLLPETHVAKSGLLLSASQSFPPGELWTFTDAVAAQRAQEVHPTLGLYSRGVDAITVLGLFNPQKFTRLWVNPKGPKEECFIFAPGAIGLLVAWTTGLSVEKAAVDNDDVRLRASMSHHPALMVAYGRSIELEAYQGEVVARVAATIDRSHEMDRRLGTQSRPMPPSALRALLGSVGATGFHLEGTGRVFPADVLGGPTA